MRIAIDNFGGIIPSRDQIALPENAAQTARNVDLSGGTLRPWAVTNAFTRLHDDAGDMLPGFSVDDIAKITQAPQVSFTKFIPICNPLWKYEVLGGTTIEVYGWLKPRAYFFFNYVDPETGEYVSEYESKWLLPTYVQHQANGFILHCYCLDTLEYTFKTGVRYQIYGPLFRFDLSPYETRRYVGGPDQAYQIPAAVESGSEQIPSIAIPLLFPTSMDSYVPNDDNVYAAYNSVTASDISTYQYGTLQCTDYNGIQLTGSREIERIPGGIEVAYSWTIGLMSFTFDCNYVRNTAHRVYFVQQMVDAEGRDGPESEVSEEVNVPPGKIAMLSTPLAAGYTKNRLFRSTSAGEGFAKLEDVDGTTFYDDLRQSLVDELPPNGNVPHATVAEAIKGAVKHPAGYAVYYYGNELRPSSEWIDMERPWAVPEEYAYAFDSEIQCIALLGGTVLVFTENAVFTAQGQHPARLAIYKVSDKPILDKRSLWTTHDMVGWVNEEGMALFSGGTVELLSGEYFRAGEWQSLDPASFSARVNDKTVCLFNSETDQDNLRFDLRGAREAAISTFDVSDGLTAFEWKSRLFQYPRPVSWYAAQVVADDYPARLVFYANGEEVADVLIEDGNAALLPRMAPARRWELFIEALHEVRGVVVATALNWVSESIQGA